MPASFSTLTATERSIVAAPSNSWDVVATIHDCGGVVDCSVRSFNGKKVLNAVKVGNDCFDITLVNHNHLQGKLVKGSTVRFVTTGTWLKEWLGAVGSTVAL
jgi:hypothetical protein